MMETEPHELILDHLRALRAGLQRVEDRLDELTIRVHGLEQSAAGLWTAYAGMAKTLDRHDERLARIEKRLDPVDA